MVFILSLLLISPWPKSFVLTADKKTYQKRLLESLKTLPGKRGCDRKADVQGGLVVSFSFAPGRSDLNPLLVGTVLSLSLPLKSAEPL